jgi:hypothetical protein
MAVARADSCGRKRFRADASPSRHGLLIPSRERVSLTQTCCQYRSNVAQTGFQYCAVDSMETTSKCT